MKEIVIRVVENKDGSIAVKTKPGREQIEKMALQCQKQGLMIPSTIVYALSMVRAAIELNTQTKKEMNTN